MTGEPDEVPSLVPIELSGLETVDTGSTQSPITWPTRSVRSSNFIRAPPVPVR